MQNHQENGAAGAQGAPDFAGVEGFVDEDDEEDAQDAHAPDAQPTVVEIPITYHWGVVAAQLDTWQYKSSEKTAQGASSRVAPNTPASPAQETRKREPSS